MKRARLWAVVLGSLLLLLAACNNAPPPEPEGPTIGDIPILLDATEVPQAEVLRAVAQVTQAHRETVRNPTLAFFEVEVPLIEAIDAYHTELDRLGWGLIDVLEFGNGGFLRRYHRDEQRAILAFHPTENGTAFMLLEGSVR